MGVDCAAPEFDIVGDPSDDQRDGLEAIREFVTTN